MRTDVEYNPFGYMFTMDVFGEFGGGEFVISPLSRWVLLSSSHVSYLIFWRRNLFVYYSSCGVGGYEFSGH